MNAVVPLRHAPRTQPASLDVACPVCGAKPGQRCHYAAGAARSHREPHLLRHRSSVQLAASSTFQAARPVTDADALREAMWTLRGIRSFAERSFTEDTTLVDGAAIGRALISIQLVCQDVLSRLAAFDPSIPEQEDRSDDDSDRPPEPQP